ncbi:MAG: DNA repair protein RadA [Gammaproteobacteria bacterium]|nr:DNA repair protein RadA [Gammaproteobacteria bacterium]NNJ79563.1 DNA repair protein RadA [Xanthomonadales bacterium]
MAKNRNAYQCDNCAATLSKWAGQCPECREWNTVNEIVTQARPSGRFRGYAGKLGNEVQDLASVGDATVARLAVGVGELDRVLGGGIVPGSVILLGGDPGIGKSTLLMQLTAALGQRVPGLYITGEESLEQLGMRARRLGLKLDGIRCLTETSIEQILGHAEKEKPKLMVVDSIQTVYTEELSSAPGSVAQIRESAAALVRWAKQNHCCVILVGHVTKEGALAGPRVLEHMVDSVLYFESDGDSRYRVIRAIKNRFGAVNELGMFAMTGTGLKEVKNPSAIFLSGHDKPVPGSVITVVREGTRPILLEVQALVDPSHLNNPRRVALGLEHNRLAMMLAVMHRHGGIALSDHDVFINVVGGMRVSETGADLPMLMALYSSFRDRPLPDKLVCFGEVGLSGEIRPVPDGEQRLREAAGHGYTTALVPVANAPRKPLDGLRIVGLSHVSAALEKVF